ncbi:MAG: dTMP kinase [Patescibacteria group bacterium]
MKNRGFLITLEGGEGGGKTTQIARLREKLTTLKQEVVLLREPGGTVISEQIRDVVLATKNVGMVFTSEVLLFQAARAQTYHEIVLPALEAGKIVVMDRSSDSSVVYQGMVRGFGKEIINQLNELSTKRTSPDLTLLLDLPVDIGLRRRHQAGDINRLDTEAKDFHEQVRQAYLSLAQENQNNRWRVIDASKSLEEVEEAIWQEVKKVLAL